MMIPSAPTMTPPSFLPSHTSTFDAQRNLANRGASVQETMDNLASNHQADRPQEPKSQGMNSIHTGKQELNSGHQDVEPSQFNTYKDRFESTMNNFLIGVENTNISTTRGRILDTNS